MILAIGAVTIGQLVIQQNASLKTSRQYQVAAGLLDEVMSKVDLIGPTTLSEQGVSEGDFSDREMENYNWSCDITQREEESYLFEVVVRVSWDARGGKQLVTAKTLLYDPPGDRDSELSWEEL